MFKEIEIKLRLAPSAFEAVRQHLLLREHAENWRHHELFNVYFDTPERDLSRARVALRIRRDAEQFIQTLKTKGHSVAGLSEREEWDWLVPTAQLVLEHLDERCWPQSLADLDKSLLAPLFHTDFKREKLDYQGQSEQGPVHIEIALDLGSVSTDSEREALCELELELREGTPGDLIWLALQLAQDIPLMPCDMSKAEQGYRLLDPEHTPFELSEPQWPADLSVEDGLLSLARHMLEVGQRAAEHYRFSGHWRVLRSWYASLSGLSMVLMDAGQVLPRQSSAELRQGLQALLLEWEPQINAGEADQAARQAAIAAFQAELDCPRWGVLSLRLALWLLECPWRSARSERAVRVASAPWSKWLLAHLQSLCAPMHLDHYLTQAQALPAQLPRLQRLQFWLRWGRQALDLPGLDRLYGELSKLIEAIQKQDLETALGQVHTLLKQDAWKRLRS